MATLPVVVDSDIFLWLALPTPFSFSWTIHIPGFSNLLPLPRSLFPQLLCHRARYCHSNNPSSPVPISVLLPVLIAETKYPTFKIKEEMAYLAHSWWRFQSIVTWLRGRVMQQRASKRESNSWQAESNKVTRERQISFCPLYCIQASGLGWCQTSVWTDLVITHSKPQNT